MEPESNNEIDPVEEVVKHIHIVLPIVGAVLSFMLVLLPLLWHENELN